MDRAPSLAFARPGGGELRVLANGVAELAVDEDQRVLTLGLDDRLIRLHQ